MKEVFLGLIKIENVEDEILKQRFIRLTVDADPFLTPQLDQMEAEGYTLAEAVMNLHQQIEAVLG
jgi:hypothetical protein